MVLEISMASPDMAESARMKSRLTLHSFLFITIWKFIELVSSVARCHMFQITLYFDWLSLAWHATERRQNWWTLCMPYILWIWNNLIRLNLYSILQSIICLPFAHILTNNIIAEFLGLQNWLVISWTMRICLRNNLLVHGTWGYC